MMIPFTGYSSLERVPRKRRTVLDYGVRSGLDNGGYEDPAVDENVVFKFEVCSSWHKLLLW